MEIELLTSTNPPLPEKWGQRIIDIMKLEYGQKFISQWAGLNESDIVKYWASELSGYSGDEIRRGIQTMKVSKWPPDLPEFRIMCRPCLDYQNAYHEAVKGLDARYRGEEFHWSHPALFWAASGLAYDLKVLNYQQIKSRWDESLAAQFAMQEWREVPKVKPQLEHKPKPISQEELNDAKQRFKEELSKMKSFNINNIDG